MLIFFPPQLNYPNSGLFSAKASSISLLVTQRDTGTLRTRAGNRKEPVAGAGGAGGAVGGLLL